MTTTDFCNMIEKGKEEVSLILIRLIMMMMMIKKTTKIFIFPDNWEISN